MKKLIRDFWFWYRRGYGLRISIDMARRSL